MNCKTTSIAVRDLKENDVFAFTQFGVGFRGFYKVIQLQILRYAVRVVYSENAIENQLGNGVFIPTTSLYPQFKTVFKIITNENL